MALETSAAPSATPSSAPAAPARGPRRRRPLVLSLLAVVVLALGVAACGPPSNPGTLTGDAYSAINQDRSANRMAGVAWDGQLASLAQTHAQELANSGSLWHSDLGGLLARTGGAWHSMGENLLMAPGGTNGFAAEDLWMNSAPHRANILGGFGSVGVGAATDGSGRVWMVALFGAR